MDVSERALYEGIAQALPGQRVVDISRAIQNYVEHNGFSVVREFVRRQGVPIGSSRALGWDTPSDNSSAGTKLSPRAFGHTGFTGTSIWIDPEKDLFVVVLTNRVNPSRNNNRHVQLRRDVADATQQAVLGARIVNWEAR